MKNATKIWSKMPQRIVFPYEVEKSHEKAVKAFYLKPLGLRDTTDKW